MSTEDLSRRDALTGGAVALAGVSVAMAVTAAPRDAEAQNAADVMALNVVLAKKYELIAAYTAALPMLMMDANFAAAARVGARFKTQHEAHAAQLATLVRAAMGTPATPPLGFQPPAGFVVTNLNIVKLAANKERELAVAGANALKTIAAKTSAAMVSAIAGCDTQHFILLSLLANGLVTAAVADDMAAAEVVPRAFVSAPGMPDVSLGSLQDLSFMTT